MSTAQALSTPEANASSALHSRINGIDTFRFLAVVGVVLIHANTKTTFGTAFDLASRFGVPFFFIVAGYFAGMKSDLSFFNAVRHVARRILVPFVVWLVLYLAYFGYGLSVLAEPRTVARLLMTGGPALHLWFLPSLAFGTLMLVVLRRFCNLPMLVGMAIVLYAAGLIVGPYGRFVFASPDLLFNARNGLFFGFPFMAVGYCLRRKAWQGSFLLGMLLYIGGLALVAGEFNILHALPGKLKLDLLLGTVPMGLGMFFMALNLPDLPVARPFAKLGRYSLGIFAAHFAPLLEFQRIFTGKSFEAELAVVILVVVTATLTALILGQFRWTRPLVR